MGARVNFVFNDGTDSHVVLYSHWGAEGYEHNLNDAIRHAQPREHDTSYWTRMVISYLIKDEILDQTGFGIYAIQQADIEGIANQELTIMIDCNTQTFEEL